MAKTKVDYRSKLEELDCDCSVRFAAKVETFDKEFIHKFWTHMSDEKTHAKGCKYRNEHFRVRVK